MGQIGERSVSENETYVRRVLSDPKYGTDSEWVRINLSPIVERLDKAEDALRKIRVEVGDFRQTDNDAIVEIERIVERWNNS